MSNPEFANGRSVCFVSMRGFIHQEMERLKLEQAPTAPTMVDLETCVSRFCTYTC